MPSIHWDGWCHVCHAPLDVFFMCFNNTELDILDSIDISCLDNNDIRYKFNDLKHNRVCLACLKNYREHRSLRLRDQEIGVRLIVKHRSMSQNEIKDWFFSLKKYFNP